MLSANQELLNRAFKSRYSKSTLALFGILAIVLVVGIGRKLPEAFLSEASHLFW